MRILILHQFFYPDHSAVSQLMTDLAESLVERGLEVTAVAGRGRYNGGERLTRREEYRGIKIERAWATSFGKSTITGRLIDYLSFYVGATWKLLRVERHDILLALTQPPLIGLIGLLIGRLRGMRVVALVQDVYPDVAVALGTLKRQSLGARFFDWLNRRALCGMDRIIVLGECMRERIRAKVGKERSQRIDIIHNWADGQLIRPLARDEANPFTVRHQLQGKFVVLFSGNFGLVNEFQTVLEAARLLRENPVVTQQFKAAIVEQVKDVFAASGEEIVEANTIVPLRDKAFAQMRADKARAARDQNSHSLLLPASCCVAAVLQ